MIQEMTDGKFENLISEHSKPIIIDFWAQRCPPCHVIAPYIEALSKEYEEQAIVCKVDVDSNPGLAVKYGIRNIPTILYIKDGKVVDKHVGSTSKAVLEEKLKAIL